jgi:hypothetical protein
VVEGEHHRRRPVPQPELGKQVVDVRLDCSLADEQLGGDLAVGPAVADEHQHLTIEPRAAVRAHLNSWFLAGFLLSPGTLRWATGNRVDVRQLEAPLLPLADQERYAQAFRHMRSLESITGHLKDRARSLTGNLTAGLIGGDFRPGREASPHEGTSS